MYSIRKYATLKVLYIRHFFHSKYSCPAYVWVYCTFHDNRSFVNRGTHIERNRKRMKREKEWMGRWTAPEFSELYRQYHLPHCCVTVWHTSKNHRQTSRRGSSPSLLFNCMCMNKGHKTFLIKHFRQKSNKSKWQMNNLDLYIVSLVTLNLVGPATSINNKHRVK